MGVQSNDYIYIVPNISNKLHQLGVHLQRHHDAYADAARILGSELENLVDGGAHHGNITLRLQEVFPGAMVHAFEPQNGPFQIIKEKLQNNPRARLYRQALGDVDGTATFYINKPNQSSLLKSLDPEQMESTGKTEEVPVVQLDSWSRSTGIVPEFMKFDLQGYELAALRGAAGILQKGVRGVLTEVNFQPRYESCSMYHDIGRYLFDMGFSLYRCYDLCGGPDGSWLQGDALFLKK